MEREAKSGNKETTILFLFSQSVCFFFFCLQRESRGELILDLEKKKRGVWGGGLSNNILAWRESEGLLKASNVNVRKKKTQMIFICVALSC